MRGFGGDITVRIDSSHFPCLVVSSVCCLSSDIDKALSPSRIASWVDYADVDLQRRLRRSEWYLNETANAARWGKLTVGLPTFDRELGLAEWATDDSLRARHLSMVIPKRTRHIRFPSATTGPSSPELFSQSSGSRIRASLPGSMVSGTIARAASRELGRERDEPSTSASGGKVLAYEKLIGFI
jgi:hypothetical protein